MRKLNTPSELKTGAAVRVHGHIGELYHSDLERRWYVLSNNSSLDGSTPENMSDIRMNMGYTYSYWVCDDEDTSISYDIQLCEPEPAAAPEPGPSFNPKPGDILHIMSKEDIKKYNSSSGLSGGGEYFNHHFKVTRVDTLDYTCSVTLCGDIIYDSGKTIRSGWLLRSYDFYEYHGIIPPVKTYVEPEVEVEYKAPSSNTYFGSIDPGPSSPKVYIGSYTSASAGITLSDIHSYIFDSSGSTLDMSKEKPLHLDNAKSVLRPTADYEIMGDRVPRDKKLDAMILLNL